MKQPHEIRIRTALGGDETARAARSAQARDASRYATISLRKQSAAGKAFARRWRKRIDIQAMLNRLYGAEA